MPAVVEVLVDAVDEEGHFESILRGDLTLQPQKGPCVRLRVAWPAYPQPVPGDISSPGAASVVFYRVLPRTSQAATLLPLEAPSRDPSVEVRFKQSRHQPGCPLLPNFLETRPEPWR